jgi:23S rRNA (pseudouridine1915-N3)-methyltransferase
MKIRLICVGVMKKSPERDLIQDYLKRSRWTIDLQELPPSSHRSGSPLKTHEADQILSRLPEGEPVIALDERGENLTSREFANLFQEFQNRGQSHVAICIGGADGLHQSVRNRATKLISFGKLTWPHLLVRVMIVEQLYRAQQILAGHPYHRD